MPTPSADVTAALATLRARWGAAAPRRIGEGAEETPTIGALAALPALHPDPDHDAPAHDPLAPAPRPFDDRPRERTPRPDDGRIVPTGFAALDAILGPGGVPRFASVAMHGDASSGKTTLALRLAAEAQAGGAIVAWLDLARSFDPIEAVARGIRLEWLVVLTPETLDEGLSIAGALLQGRAVDLLLIDLPAGLRTEEPRPREQPAAGRTPATGRAPASDRVPAAGRAPGARPPSLADRLHRLAALARRAGCLLVVLEPPGLPSAVTGALGESVGLRLELARRAWIRLGRDVVGQRTEVVVARNHFGPPGRRADLRILYADGGRRDDCLTVDPLLREAAIQTTQTTQPPGLHVLTSATGPPLTGGLAAPAPASADAPDHSPRIRQHATAPPALATPSPSARPSAVGERQLRVVPGRALVPGRAFVPDEPPTRGEPPTRSMPPVPHGAGRPRRPAMGRRAGPRHEPGGPRAGHPARDAAGRGPSPVAGGGLPRP